MIHSLFIVSFSQNYSPPPLLERGSQISMTGHFERQTAYRECQISQLNYRNLFLFKAPPSPPPLTEIHLATV